MALEEAFDIEIPDEAAEGITTVGDAVKYIEDKQALRDGMVDGLHRVVVTGLGAVTPIGNTVQDYWDGITSGRNGVEAITLFDASSHACRFAAEVKVFNPSGLIEPKEAKRWDRFCKFGVVAASKPLLMPIYRSQMQTPSESADHRVLASVVC